MSLPSVKIVLIGLAMVVMTGWAQGGQAQPVQARNTRVPAIVARVLPAVVSITARRIERDQFNRPVPKAGLGSGVIVDRQGHILTNNHVVEGFDEFKVTLPDGRTFRGSLAGGDRFTDLAVLKIQGKNLRPLLLGDSSKLAIGETVIAIGIPLWIEGGPTVTVGVVSGKGRSMEEPDEPDRPMPHNLLQTEAAINPGNSGGPLLNLTGEIMAINTAIIPSAHGIGFAIPINNAKPVLKTPLEFGALVVRVEKGGPAEAVGLRPDDVIVAFGDKVVTDLHHLHALLAERKPGDTVEVTVWRDGQTLTFSPVLSQDK